MPGPPSIAANAVARCACVAVGTLLLATSGPTQEPTALLPQKPVATAQDPTAEARAAVLRAMVVLKIAPYLTQDGTEQPNDKTPYRLAVVGDDATVAAIQRHLPAKAVGKRPVEVVAVSEKEAAAPQQQRRFDAMFLAHDLEPKVVTAIVGAHAKLATVLVSERAGFAKAGGGVQLFVEDNGLRFEVNQDALKKQGVRASSQLLKLSKRGPEQ